MSEESYFLVEVLDKSTMSSNHCLVTETNLGALISNYDKELFAVVNVACIGFLEMDFKKFIKQEVKLEKGDSNVI